MIYIEQNATNNIFVNVSQYKTGNFGTNPIQDCDDNWIISTEEVNNSKYPEHQWIKSMPQIEWCAPPIPPIPPIN
jgi:hypothetical protein